MKESDIIHQIIINEEFILHSTEYCIDTMGSGPSSCGIGTTSDQSIASKSDSIAKYFNQSMNIEDKDDQW
jgi:hypothetical protein